MSSASTFSSPDFIHLRVHSEYSVIDGLVKVKGLVNKAAELGMPAVAITDHNNFYALIKFFMAANNKGIKPICGCDVLVAEDDDPEQISVLVMLIKDKVGYRNLTELISRAHQEGQYRGKVCLKKSWLTGNTDGLIALSAARDGDIGKALEKDDFIVASDRLDHWMTIFPNNFYLELQRTGKPGDDSHVVKAVDLALQKNCPVVATNNVRFLSETEFEAHEARVCINERRTLDDPRRSRNYSEGQYLRSQQEMLKLFEDIPEALQNSVEIAKRCTLDLELGVPYLPDYPIPDGLTLDEFFRKESEDGLHRRLEVLFDISSPEFVEQKKPYYERLDFELGIINQMGFPGYFLIVMEFIQWAKDNDIPVGPGRGSGAGSLVAYALKITDLDPLEYDLLFERFLNPERVSMPDFDVDFCMDGRDRVIEHVADLYGQQAVSQIITFGTMAAKAVIRDVARVQGKSYGLADKLSKLVPFEPGMTLDKAFKEEPLLGQMRENDEDADEIMDMAFKLEGVIRNVGKHAGGVVIAPGKLTDFTPLYCDETGANLVTQYDKNDVESAGLIKFDFLGLKTLTIIDWALKMINTEDVTDVIDINQIPLDDENVYNMLEAGETTAVFQLESRGMKDLIKRLKPNTFEDIVALVALFRPGPLGSGMVDDFINRKHGRAAVSYPHPDLEPVLNNTYGVILYQEQVMQIAQVLADYSLGSADMLRRAMGKKKASEMQKQREFFLAGAAKNEIDEKNANEIFDLMEKFADYGFNKSHSAAYALVSYQTAWLKFHYPAHFMAAAMSAEMQNTDKVEILVEECRYMKLVLASPNVNFGEHSFTVDKQNRIAYGLGAIKGLGEGPVTNIIQSRNADGVFSHLFDFCKRVDLSQVNKRAIDALIRSGGFDSFGASRAVLLASMSEAIKTAEQSSRSEASGISDLFGEIVPAADNADVYENFRSVKPWSPKRLLQEEQETLGIYLSGHPIEEYLPEIALLTKNRISNIKASKSPQLLAALIKSMRILTTARGVTMAILLLDDCGQQIEASLMGEVFERYRDDLSKNAVVLLEGIINVNQYAGDGSMQVRIKRIWQFEKARQHYIKNITLSLHQHNMPVKSTQTLQGILIDYLEEESALTPEDGSSSKPCEIVVCYARKEVSGKVTLGKQWRVKAEDELLYKLKDEYGEKQVALVY